MNPGIHRAQNNNPMKTCIALLRGINVGGKNLLPMKELVAMLGDLGAQNVKTYIQSGNAVFVWKDKDTSQLSNQIRAEIKKRRGFDPDVLILELGDFERVIQQNPFPEAEAGPKALHAGFLAAAPERPDLKTLESLKSDSERFRLIGSVFYVHAPEGVGRSKLAAKAERLLGVPMTDRNWRTVLTLWKMAQELE
jgi:uncharacterized protein (DUF1697 family)